MCFILKVALRISMKFNLILYWTDTPTINSDNPVRLLIYNDKALGRIKIVFHAISFMTFFSNLTL